MSFGLSNARIYSPYSRNNLPKTKDRSYVLNLDEYKSLGTHLDCFVCEWE